MMTEAAIRRQINQIKFRVRKKRLKEALAERPPNCKFRKQFEVRLDTGSPYGDDLHQVCVCMKGVQNDGWRALQCEGPALPTECPGFQHRRDKETLKQEFEAEWRELLSKPKSEVAAAGHPDVAALLWVLNEAPAIVDGEDDDTEEEDGDDDDDDDEPAPPVQPDAAWWQVWVWLPRLVKSS